MNPSVKETLVDAFRAAGWGFIEACEHAEGTIIEARDHIARTGTPYRFEIRQGQGSPRMVYEIAGRR